MAGVHRGDVPTPAGQPLDRRVRTRPLSTRCGHPGLNSSGAPSAWGVPPPIAEMMEIHRKFPVLRRCQSFSKEHPGSLLPAVSLTSWPLITFCDADDDAHRHDACSVARNANVRLPVGDRAGGRRKRQHAVGRAPQRAEHRPHGHRGAGQAARRPADRRLLAVQG